MRKIIVSEFVSLDGVMEAPDKWSFRFWNEETAQYKYDELFASEALLIGRVTYQIFAEAWPKMNQKGMIENVKRAGGDTSAMEADTSGEGGDKFTERMNGIQKFVVSNTLEKAEWNNSRLIKGDVFGELEKIKHTRGGPILVEGSAQLVNGLIKEGLVDEMRLMVFPVVVGSGKHLFGEGLDKTRLKLAKTKKFKTGVVVLTYKTVKS